MDMLPSCGTPKGPWDQNSFVPLVRIFKSLLAMEALPRFVIRAAYCSQTVANLDFQQAHSLSFICATGFSIRNSDTTNVKRLRFLTDAEEYQRDPWNSNDARALFGCAVLEKYSNVNGVTQFSPNCNGLKRNPRKDAFETAMQEVRKSLETDLKPKFTSQIQKMLSLSMLLTPEQCKCDRKTVGYRLRDVNNIVLKVRLTKPPMNKKKDFDPLIEPPALNGEERSTRVYRWFEVKTVYRKKTGRKFNQALCRSEYGNIKHIRQLFHDGLPCQDPLMYFKEKEAYILVGKMDIRDGVKTFFLDPCSVVRRTDDALSTLSQADSQFLNSNVLCEF